MKKKREHNQQLVQKEKFQDQNAITLNTLKGKIQKQEKLTSDDQNIISKMINSNLQQQQNEIDLYQFFSDSIWTLQFEQNFLKKLFDMKHQQKHLLYHLCYLTQGHFVKQQEISTKAIILPLMKVYQGSFQSFHNGLCIIFECGLRKTIKEDTKSINVKFIHKMTFIDILEQEKNLEKIVIELLQHYQQSQVNLIDSSTIQYLKEVSLSEMVNKNTRAPNIEQLFKKNVEQNWTILQFQASKEKVQWFPNYFDCIKLNKDENNNLLKDEQIIKQIELDKLQAIKERSQVIDSMFYNISIEQIASILVKLSVMKNMVITEQENTVLNQNNNALVIGRSGTGKTTCSILKILSLQILFLINYELGLFGQDKSFYLRIVFTTQNQILINEMRRFFLKLLKNDEIKQQNDQIQQIVLRNLEKLAKNFDKWKIDQRESLQKSFKPDYPAIISSNQFLILIDNSLPVSFFKQFKIERKRIEGAGWQKNEQDYVQQVVEGNNSKLNQLKQDINNMKQFQLHEVDFDSFQELFFSKFKKKFGDLQNETTFCNLLWSQIFSVIKGSKHSHCYPNRYLPQEVYLIYPQQQHVNEKTMQQIYSYFLIYEKWKSQNNYFDLMDLVNYIIDQIKLGNYQGQCIHYLFVDEVQDFTQATLYLFFLLAEYKITLSGDTAQTIIKGVSFKFQDLKQIFHGVKEFETYALTINFRSQNQILQLANSIISMIEILFPKSIDFLKKEQSQQQGPRPFVIHQTDIKSVIYLLQGKDDGRIEFGCYQAVITKKDAEVPEMLNHLISLNIQECKGLEFDDVILLNFFDDQKYSQKHWELLKMINVENENGELKLRANQNLKQVDIQDFTALCEELKYLYVAITRGKKRIFIFDQNPSKRKIIEQLWAELGLVQIISFENSSDRKSNISEMLNNKNSEKEWQEQGMKLFQLKYYEQAAKCFRYAKDSIMENYSIAFKLAGLAQAGLQEVIKQGNTKSETVQQCYNLFQEAGQKFLLAQKIEYAADCFFSGNAYHYALELYIQIGNWNNAAITSDRLNLNFLTGILHWRNNQIEKCLKEFELNNDAFLFLSILKSLRNKLSEKMYFHKFHQWFPKLIQQIMTPVNIDHSSQLQILKQNVTNYKQEFKILIIAIENSQIVYQCDQLLDLIYFYAEKYIDEIILLLSQIHINFDQNLAKDIIKTKSQGFSRLKIKILQDLFQYYKLEQFLVLLEQNYNVPISSQKLFIKLFDASKIFGTQNQKNEESQEEGLNEFFDNNSKCWNIQNYLQPLYELSQLGFHKLSLRMLQNIYSQLTDQLKNLEEDYEELNFIFFKLDFLYDFDYITAILDLYFREWNKQSELPQKIQDQLQRQFQFFMKIQQFLQQSEALQAQDLEYIFNVISPVTQNTQITSQNEKLIISIIILQIIILIQKVEPSKLKTQFDQLNHVQYLHLVRYLQICIDLFKYNKDLKQQFIQFYAICCVFSLRIPSKLTFAQLAQSMTFIHKDSILFQLNLLQTEQCNLMDNEKNIHICSSQQIFNIISNYLKKFLLKYSQRYFVNEQKVIYSKAPIIIQLYSYLILKSKENYDVPQGIQKFLLFQEVYTDFYLEKCFKILIIDQLFNLISQCAEPKLIIIKRILSELSTYYFFKCLQEKNPQIMHQNIMIGLGIQNIAHEQNISLAFIKYLQQQQQQLTFLENYYQYAEYLQITNFCFSLQACQKYLEFHKKQKDLLQSQQIIKDLTLLTLILVCHNLSSITEQITQVFLPDSFLKLLQNNQVDNYYEIKINKSLISDQLNIIIQEQMCDLISSLIKTSTQKEYQIYLRLILVMLLNVEAFWEGWSDKLYNLADQVEYEEQEQDLQIVAELILKNKKERFKYFENPGKFKLVNIKFIYVDDQAIEEYLSKKRIRKIESHFLDKMKFQYQEHLKNKFNNFYIGIHLLLFRPLSFTTGQITEKSIEERQVLQLFEKIDFIRKLLIQVLYSPIIDTIGHFLAVTGELRKLSKFESELDFYISKNERNFQRDIEDPGKILNDLSIIQQNIENWKNLNQQLNHNLQKLEYSFIKQKEEEDEAFELLKQNINKIIS